ncbi:MAG: ECF-type riboflavin transporter substrate-binding protein [Clostridia bacterium]|nr:ECF-type riboflavin transporter substrate-binding protein [Clostridia bacterium]
MKKFGVKTIVATGIGAAIFFLLARFLSIPVFANTYVNFQYAVLGFFAVVFGPVAGLLIGLIGHVLTDLASGYGLWWSWIIVSALVGGASGFLVKKDVEAGELNTADIVRFIVGSVIVHLIGWGAAAPLLDILIYAEPADKVFTQGLIAGASNIVTTVIIGSLLLWAYSKTRAKPGSLEKE